MDKTFAPELMRKFSSELKKSQLPVDATPLLVTLRLEQLRVAERMRAEAARPVPNDARSNPPA
jgi:hypothetical protein